MQSLRNLSQDLFGHPSLLLWLLASAGFALVIIAALFFLFFGGLNISAGFDTPTPAVASFVTLTPAPALPAPPFQILPTQGGPGTAITVAGQGWQPGDTVLVSLENPLDPQRPQTAVATTQVTDQGNFVVSFNFPADGYWDKLPQALVTVQSTATGQKGGQEFLLSPLATPVSPTLIPELTLTFTPPAPPLTPLPPATTGPAPAFTPFPT
jgi:hypothetical protein